MITEAAVGAGLSSRETRLRAITERGRLGIGHLVPRSSCFAFLTLTVGFANGARCSSFAGRGGQSRCSRLRCRAFVCWPERFVAALSNMLFPSAVDCRGHCEDFSAASNVVLRLRLAIRSCYLVAVYVIFVSGYLKKHWTRGCGGEMVDCLSVLVLVQIASVPQIAHARPTLCSLALAACGSDMDSFCLFAANSLSSESRAYVNFGSAISPVTTSSFNESSSSRRLLSVLITAFAST